MHQCTQDNLSGSPSASCTSLRAAEMAPNILDSQDLSDGRDLGEDGLGVYEALFCWWINPTLKAREVETFQILFLIRCLRNLVWPLSESQKLTYLSSKYFGARRRAAWIVLLKNQLGWTLPDVSLPLSTQGCRIIHSISPFNSSSEPDQNPIDFFSSSSFDYLQQVFGVHLLWCCHEAYFRSRHLTRDLMDRSKTITSQDII